MRLQITMQAEQGKFPMDYHSVIISMVKAGLSRYHKGEYFKEVYDGTARQRPFTFAACFPRGSRYEKDTITFPEGKDLIHVKASTNDEDMGILLYNAFREIRWEAYPLAGGNSVKIKNISLDMAGEIHSEDILVRTVSPVCVRSSDPGESGRIFTSVERPMFEEELKAQLKRKYHDDPQITEEIDGARFLPVSMKKVVLRIFHKQVEMSAGTMLIHGSPHFLKEILGNGLGTKCAEGCGMLEVLKEEG